MDKGQVSACALTIPTVWNALCPDGWASSSSFLKALFEFYLLHEDLDLHPTGILSLPFPRAPWNLLPAHPLLMLQSLVGPYPAGELGHPFVHPYTEWNDG